MSERDPATQHRDRLVLADRVHHYNAPIDHMFAVLTENRSWWLSLQPGEIEPRILEAVAPSRVVWSSFWPVSPDDTIEFDLSGVAGIGPTAIRFRWFSDAPPDERGIGITRQRLNRKFGGDLRAVTSEPFWTERGL